MYLTGLPFYWSKILPISYDNYQSETEILNAICLKFEEWIKVVNSISKFLEEDLSGYIGEEAKKQTEHLQEQIEGIKADLASLEDYLQEQIEGINTWFGRELENVQIQVTQALRFIESEIERVNLELESKIANLDAKIDRAKALLQSEIDLNRSESIMLISKYHLHTIRYVEDRISKIKYDIKVTSPISYKEVPLQEALWDIAGMFAQTPTMQEYAGYSLSMGDYEKFHMTMRDYWLWGNPILRKGVPRPIFKEPEVKDIFGKPRFNAVSSAYYLTDGSQPMDNYGLSMDEYRKFSENAGMYEIDRRGRYWLANIAASVYRDVIHLRADSVATTHFGINHLSVLLKPDHDFSDPSVPTQELLTDNSVDKLVKDVSLEIVDYAEGYVQWTASSPTLVSGGIALNLDVNVQAYDPNDDPCTVVVDVTGITTTY